MLEDLPLDWAGAAVQASAVAEAIRIKLAAPYFITSKKPRALGLTVEHCCSVSIGAALYGPNDSVQPDVLERADAAMYRAKAAGRNTVQFFGADAST